jgi:catechol 2,3-dioxygenase-like lactoylglutathione lyase family enzyme
MWVPPDNGHRQLQETPMIDHISIGVSNIPASRRFYDATLNPLGYKCLSEGESTLGYGKDSVVLWVNVAERPVPADPKSGLHFCFSAPTRKSVDSFHAGALKSGGTDNGAPGVRADYDANYYAAFVVDPDGYRIEAYCSKP